MKISLENIMIELMVYLGTKPVYTKIQKKLKYQCISSFSTREEESSFALNGRPGEILER